MAADSLTEDYRPFSFADASGKVEGIDVDMAMRLAQSFGVRLEIVKTSWPMLKSDLEANSLDIAMGGITIATGGGLGGEAAFAWPRHGHAQRGAFGALRASSEYAAFSLGHKLLQIRP